MVLLFDAINVVDAVIIALSTLNVNAFSKIKTHKLILWNLCKCYINLLSFLPVRAHECNLKYNNTYEQEIFTYRINKKQHCFLYKETVLLSL